MSRWESRGWWVIGPLGRCSERREFLRGAFQSEAVVGCVHIDYTLPGSANDGPLMKLHTSAQFQCFAKSATFRISIYGASEGRGQPTQEAKEHTNTDITSAVRRVSVSGHLAHARPVAFNLGGTGVKFQSLCAKVCRLTCYTCTCAG